MHTAQPQHMHAATATRHRLTATHSPPAATPSETATLGFYLKFDPAPLSAMRQGFIRFALRFGLGAWAGRFLARYSDSAFARDAGIPSRTCEM
jgi:hypothetical protein